MTFPCKSLLLAAMFGMAAVAHAAGLAFDAGDQAALDSYARPAATVAEPAQAVRAQAPIAHAETTSGNFDAPPSIGGQGGKAAATPSANANQEVLAQLIGMNTTLRAAA